MEERINKERRIFVIVITLIFVSFLIGMTYAFFNYTRTGTANNIRTGRMAFNTEQGDTVTLSDLFPIENTGNITSATPGVGSLSIHVTGDTTYESGIEYKVTAVNVTSASTGNELPISIEISYEANGQGKTVGEEDEDYFTNRGGNSSIYKLLSTNTITDGGDILIGYIASGETGIDGNINIIAYLDAANIAITDTIEDGDIEVPGYTNGTDTDWIDGRTVFTTEEWNALQASGVSFQIKVEANEGIWVSEPTSPLSAYADIQSNADTEKLINFAYTSSSSNGEGLYLLPGTENDIYPIYYYRGNVNDNNVIFGGFCWQIVRTTETGGIKMIYNGEATDNGTTCTNTTHETRILESTSKYNSNNSSLADIGYMSNIRTVTVSAPAENGSIYGKDIEWDGTHYLVIEDTSGVASTNTTKDSYHHYTCGNEGVTSCTSIRYYFYQNYYLYLANGKLLEDVIYELTGNGSQTVKNKHSEYNINTNDSTVKEAIDDWFRTNLTNEEDNTKTDYKQYVEDTVFCNDRSFKTIAGNGGFSTYEQAGLNPNGGGLDTSIAFGFWNRFRNSDWFSTTNVPAVKNTGTIPNVVCPNEADRFTVSSTIGNGALTYPVGLLTADEVVLAGAAGNGSFENTNYYLYTGDKFWTMTPYDHALGISNQFNVYSNGSLLADIVSTKIGVRPVISLKVGTSFVDGGDGTPTNPYVVNYN